MSTYALSQQVGLLRHSLFGGVSLVRDSSEIDHHDLIVRVRSGDYFASLAVMLQNLASNPHTDEQTLKDMLYIFSEELLYLQDTHKIVKKN